jgi:hypothetical protein
VRGTVVAFPVGRPAVWCIGVVVESAAGAAWVAYVNRAELARVDADRVPVTRPSTLFPVPAGTIRSARTQREHPAQREGAPRPAPSTP